MAQPAVLLRLRGVPRPQEGRPGLREDSRKDQAGGVELSSERVSAYVSRYFFSASGASAMPWPGRSGTRNAPPSHFGSPSKRSPGVQSLNSSRKVLGSAAAPVTHSS